MDLQTLLNGYNKATLQAMARTLGVAPIPKDRSQVIRQLVATASDAQVINHALEQLTANERALLEIVQLAGGEISVGALRLLAARQGLIDKQARPPTGRGAPAAKGNTLEEQVARLTAACLLLTSGQRTYGGLLGFELLSQLVIPPPVLAVLPPLPQQIEQLAATPPPTIRSADPAAFQRDLYLYWSFVRDNRVTLTARNLVSKPQLKKINALLSQSEPVDEMRDENEAGRLRFIRHILLECGLITRSADRLVVTPQGEGFFARPLAERTKAAFNAYRNASFWDDLMQIPCLEIEGRRSTQSEALPFVVQGRGKLLELFTHLPAEGWLSCEGILERVRRRSYEFLLPRKSSAYGYGSLPPNPYVSYGNDQSWSFYVVRSGQETYAGYIRDEAEGWDAVEGGMIAAVLRDPLHWLGLFDLGVAPDPDAPGGEQLVAVRVTPLGAHVLMGAPPPEGDKLPSGRLIVQPTFQVLAYPPVSEVQLALLDRVAERGRLEQVAEYRLTRESLYRARQQHGLTVEQVVASLEQESGAALPQNVAYTLAEWGQAQERVLLHEEVALLTVSEASLLDGLLADPVTAPHITRRLTATAALVRRGDLPAIERVLLHRGQLPLRLDAPPDMAAGGRWLTIADDGLLTLHPGAPEIYLRRALRPFSGEEGAAMRITSAGVRQAQADGLTLEELLLRLDAWCGGELPPGLATQIKAWGGFYGSALVERPLLLRLEDERVLTGLLDDPELAPLLRPYRPEGVLVEIDPEQFERASALLAARGMNLSGPALPSGPQEPPTAQEPTITEETPRRRGRPRRAT